MNALILHYVYNPHVSNGFGYPDHVLNVCPTFPCLTGSVYLMLLYQISYSRKKIAEVTVFAVRLTARYNK